MSHGRPMDCQYKQGCCCGGRLNTLIIILMVFFYFQKDICSCASLKLAVIRFAIKETVILVCLLVCRYVSKPPIGYTDKLIWGKYGVTQAFISSWILQVFQKTEEREGKSAAEMLHRSHFRTFSRMLCLVDHYVVAGYLSNLSPRAITAIIQNILKSYRFNFWENKKILQYFQ